MTTILLLTLTFAGALLTLGVSRLPTYRALILKAIGGSAGLLYFSYRAIAAPSAAQSADTSVWTELFWAFIALTILVNAAVNLSRRQPQIID